MKRMFNILIKKLTNSDFRNYDPCDLVPLLKRLFENIQKRSLSAKRSNLVVHSSISQVSKTAFLASQLYKLYNQIEQVGLIYATH